jgi:hypothetical protein
MQLDIFEPIETRPQNKEVFSKEHSDSQDKIVYDYLMAGRRLNTNTARRFYFQQKWHSILDLRPRVAKLGKSEDKGGWGAAIRYELIQNGHGLKDWYMSPEDIIFNKNKFK